MFFLTFYGKVSNLIQFTRFFKKMAGALHNLHLFRRTDLAKSLPVHLKTSASRLPIISRVAAVTFHSPSIAKSGRRFLDTIALILLPQYAAPQCRSSSGACSKISYRQIFNGYFLNKPFSSLNHFQYIKPAITSVLITLTYNYVIFP